MGDVSWSAGVPRENFGAYAPNNMSGYPGVAPPAFVQYPNQIPSAPMHESSYGLPAAGSNNAGGAQGGDVFGSAPSHMYPAGPPVYNPPSQPSLIDGLNMPSGNVYSPSPYPAAVPQPTAPTAYVESGPTYPSVPSQPPPRPTAPSSYADGGVTYPSLPSQPPTQFGYTDLPHLQHQNAGGSYPDFVGGTVPHMSGYSPSQTEALHSRPSFNRPGAYAHQGDSYETSGASYPSTVSYESQQGGFDVGGGGDVFAYDGGNEEPYGARGAYGGSQWEDKPVGGTGAAGGDEDDGLQKFRVKLLPEEGSDKRPVSVVCQIGLDGVRLLDPESNKTLRIYPLETITRWAPAVKDSSVFTFWAKSAVDVEQRPVRLQSTQRTTTDILDTLTAACVQLVEMRPPTSGGDGKDKGATDKDGSKGKSTAPMSFVPWMPTLTTKPAAVEEKLHWVPDEHATKCKACSADFTPFNRRHHCRNCGDIFCDKCTRGRIALTQEEGAVPVRVCDNCLAEVTHRITNAQPTSTTPTSTLRSHSDLAKTLQEEMERNSRRALAAATASGTKPSASGGSGEGSGRAASSGPASVVSCSKCGSVSFVTGGETKCVSCGNDTSRPAQPSPVTSSMDTWFHHGSGQQSAMQQPQQPQQPAWVPQGPPHLWPSNQVQTPPDSARMREVACPTCTVHLQVRVPASGTETVECGVCEHPFLVPAN